jgi:hypothetical protein
MPEFESMFIRSKGQPIAWEGKTLFLHDYFPTEGAVRYRLTLESCDSNWRQGVMMALLHTDDRGRWQPGVAKDVPGHFIINAQRVDGSKGAVIWQDEAPSEVGFEVVGAPATICVYNVWQSTTRVAIPGTTTGPVIDSGHNGAAMIVEELPNGRRYRCNDGKPNDDFNDIVFRLERVK